VTALGSKPHVLYLSPVVPSLSGNGLAMRAGTVLEGLAASYSISLLVLALYPPFVPRVPRFFQSLCQGAAVLRPPIRRWHKWFGPLAALQRSAPDVVHVFRLAMWPYAWQLFERRKERTLLHLDLDDIESTTHSRIAALCRSNGDRTREHFEMLQAQRSEKEQEQALRWFDRIYICSEADRLALNRGAGADICVLPNAVRIPSGSPEEKHVKNGSLLFVGTLGYYPNEDGACYLCSEIVPRVRKQGHANLEVGIVGAAASDRINEAASRAGVRVLGFVNDLADCYREADVVVVPIRAGGGTRIKVLEAFSYRRPVVTTPQGIEGIDARHNEHVLIGHTPEEFASSCVRLLGDRALSEKVVRNAWDLLTGRYSIEVLKATIASSLPSPLRPRSRSIVMPLCAR
jgi:polysaccharide biosynthesis protein PslH